MITANQRGGRRSFPPETCGHKTWETCCSCSNPLWTNEMVSSESLMDVLHPFLKKQFVTSQHGIRSHSGTFSVSTGTSLPWRWAHGDSVIKTVSRLRLLRGFLPLRHIYDSGYVLKHYQHNRAHRDHLVMQFSGRREGSKVDDSWLQNVLFTSWVDSLCLK